MNLKQQFHHQLYGITSLEHSRGRSNEKVVEEMLRAGVRIIQYRDKNRSKRVRYDECVALRHLTRLYHALFIVNDDVDIALAVGADGVHVGQHDMPLKAVRALVGNRCFIGLSTETCDQANTAVAEGADYIGVGPIYATATKKDAAAPGGLALLDYTVKHIPLPIVAIGGISHANMGELIAHGGTCLAMVSALVGADSITHAVREAQSHFDKASSKDI